VSAPERDRAVAPEDLAKVAGRFRLAGDWLDGAPFGSGHINDTFAVRVRTASGAPRRHILQRVNTRVFRDPVSLMRNIEAVTRHLSRAILRDGGDPLRETLTLIPTRDGTGASFLEADASFGTGAGFWRAYVFLEGMTGYDAIRSPADMKEAARAFGIFRRRLSDFPADTLHETIPGFHDTPRRLHAFERAVERDAAGRAGGVAQEVAFVRERAGTAGLVMDGLRSGRLPWTVTHNDTKINNVMLDDATGAGTCVIDLDTVMPGSCLFDFGDAIRFGANTAAEDETDLARVTVSLARFRAFAEGYLAASGDAMTRDERSLLAFSARLMTYECGVRFLTDFLEGDTYFRTHREGHNLDRARNQFHLVSEMEGNAEEMEWIVRESGDAADPGG
jgi:hypothetical protein